MPQSTLSRRTRDPEIEASPGPDRSIMTIRGQRAIVDSDLARLYGVSTKALNQAIKRNADRFPDDFCFRLTAREKKEVVTNCDHLQALRYSPTRPRAFTEHGSLMAANVLSAPRAVMASITHNAISAADENVAHPGDLLFSWSDRATRSLSTMREGLLPKLLSGEIRVRDAEKQVEGAV